MSGPRHPTARARVNSRRPQAHAICQRCSFRYNRVDLRPQFQWAGPRLQNLELYVCCECMDVPQPAPKSIIIPGDPIPVYKPFPELFAVVEPSFIATETPSAFFGQDITDELNDPLIWEIEDTPLPDPNNPVLYPNQPNVVITLTNLAPGWTIIS